MLKNGNQNPAEAAEGAALFRPTRGFEALDADRGGCSDE